MRSLSVLGLVACLALTGCESLSEVASDVRDKVAERNEPRMKVYAGPQRTVYESVRTAADKMGYRILRGGAAQGQLDAVSGLSSSDSLRSSRQISMKVRLEPGAAPDTTNVEIRLTEVIEDDSSNRSGLATETPLRDTPQYEVFFRSVQQALDAKADTAKG